MAEIGRGDAKLIGLPTDDERHEKADGGCRMDVYLEEGPKGDSRG